MRKQVPYDSVDHSPESESGKEFHSLSLRILQHANLENSIRDFLRQGTRILLDFTGCDIVGIYIVDDPVNCYGEISRKPQESFVFETMNPTDEKGGKLSSRLPVTDPLIKEILSGKFKPSSKFVTGKGSAFMGDVGDVPDGFSCAGQEQDDDRASLFAGCRSLVLIPITAAGETIGLLQMRSGREDYFTAEDVEFYEGIGDILAVALVSYRAQTALRERVKELSCLYCIAQIASEPGLSLDAEMRDIVDLLPPAWQYPKITAGRIILDGQTYSITGFEEEWQSLSAEILINGAKRGIIEVAYTEMMPELNEGPFLREERNLIDAVAGLVSQLIERKQAEEDRGKLQDQLRHADRLATIGQLAAGVAHEFNEPLGNILGFAQLILKNEYLTDDIRLDLDKIVSASMHAREVIKKLMLFARQLPSKKAKVNLNEVIDEGLYFLDARCAKAGIELVRLLDPDLPDIMADQAQLHQVLVNLVVNAIQAMPDGGTITITTKCHVKNISLKVTDTGTGMSEDVMKQLFIPFFTTKDVDEGTGLGLPVVHGIVTSHGGTIKVASKFGEGSSFEISLPIQGPGSDEVTEV